MRSPTLALAAACIATAASAFYTAPITPARRWTPSTRADRGVATSAASAVTAASTSSLTTMSATMDATMNAPPYSLPPDAYAHEINSPTDTAIGGATKAIAAAEADLPAAASSTPMVSSPMGIFDPVLIETMQYKLGGHKEPVLREFFDDYSSVGPMGAMKHMGTPGVASRLAVLMAEATGAHSSSSSRGVGWCR